MINEKSQKRHETLISRSQPLQCQHWFPTVGEMGVLIGRDRQEGVGGGVGRGEAGEEPLYFLPLGTSLEGTWKSDVVHKSLAGPSNVSPHFVHFEL